MKYKPESDNETTVMSICRLDAFLTFVADILATNYDASM